MNSGSNNAYIHVKKAKKNRPNGRSEESVRPDLPDREDGTIRHIHPGGEDMKVLCPQADLIPGFLQRVERSRCGQFAVDDAVTMGDDGPEKFLHRKSFLLDYNAIRRGRSFNILQDTSV